MMLDATPKTLHDTVLQLVYLGKGKFVHALVRIVKSPIDAWLQPEK
jgi:hypothetical protein